MEFKDTDGKDRPENKRLSAQRNQDYLADTRRTKGFLVYSDVDRFKSINDTLRHDVGDSVLSTRRSCRQIHRHEITDGFGG